MDLTDSCTLLAYFFVIFVFLFSLFLDENIDSLENSLSSEDLVCSNEQVLTYYAEECLNHGNYGCETDWQQIGTDFNLDVACV